MLPQVHRSKGNNADYAALFCPSIPTGMRDSGEGMGRLGNDAHFTQRSCARAYNLLRMPDAAGLDAPRLRRIHYLSESQR